MDQKEYTVVCIDDEKAFHKLLSRKFTNSSFKYIEVYDGETGVKTALEKKPDVALIDIMLPGIDGWEVFEQLRKDEWGKYLPVVILTSIQFRRKINEELAKTMIYIVKSEWSLEDIVKLTHEFCVLCDYYREMGKTDWDVVSLTNKVKERMGIE